MQTAGLLETLRALEIALHQGDVRSDPARLSALLHEQFREIGRSGTVWSRDATLAEFAGGAQAHAIWAQDFAVEELAPGIALLTYRSAHVVDAGTLERHTLRSSIWVLSDGGWRMRFHQGTPTTPFDKHAT
jgi:hypothetical protein